MLFSTVFKRAQIAAGPDLVGSAFMYGARTPGNDDNVKNAEISSRCTVNQLVLFPFPVFVGKRSSGSIIFPTDFL